MYKNPRIQATLTGNQITFKLLIKSSVRTFTFSLAEELGEGAEGRVYKAYPVGSNGRPNTEQPWAVKVQKRHYFTPDEHHFGQYYLRTLPPVWVGNYVYTFLEYLHGFDLTDEHEYLHEELRGDKLTLAQRLSLIQQLVLYVHHLHHNSPRTGEAILHGDLKGENVNIYIDKKKQAHLRVLDFGFAMLLPQGSVAKHRRNIKGNAFYAAPETVDGKFGAATDIFMLVELILALLNVLHPGKNKGERYESLEEEYRHKRRNIPRIKQIAMSAITPPFEEIKLPTLSDSIPLEEPCIKFLRQMCDREYRKRPNSEQVLQFFTSLRLVYQLDDVRHNCKRNNTPFEHTLEFLQHISHIDISADQLSLPGEHLTRPSRCQFKYKYWQIVNQLVSITSYCKGLLDSSNQDSIKVLTALEITLLCEALSKCFSQAMKPITFKNFSEIVLKNFLGNIEKSLGSSTHIKTSEYFFKLLTSLSFGMPTHTLHAKLRTATELFVYLLENSKDEKIEAVIKNPPSYYNWVNFYYDRQELVEQYSKGLKTLNEKLISNKTSPFIPV